MGFRSLVVAAAFVATTTGCVQVNADVRAAEKTYREQLGKRLPVVPGLKKTAGEEILPLASGGDLV
jgi:hypothetical protein